MKTFMIKRKTKTAPSWSFILMLLMTTDKFFEFDQICVDQGLNLVFEGRAILHRISSNSSMVFTYGIDIVSFWIWRSFRPCGNDRNPTILDQYGEQLCIRHRKWMVHFGPFPFLALVIAWVRPLTIFPCRHLGEKHLIGGTWEYGVREWKRFPTDSSIGSNSLLLGSSTCLLGTFPFFPNVVALVSTILPLFTPSSILPT